MWRSPLLCSTRFIALRRMRPTFGRYFGSGADSVLAAIRLTNLKAPDLAAQSFMMSAVRALAEDSD